MDKAESLAAQFAAVVFHVGSLAGGPVVRRATSVVMGDLSGC